MSSLIKIVVLLLIAYPVWQISEALYQKSGKSFIRYLAQDTVREIRNLNSFSPWWGQKHDSNEKNRVVLCVPPDSESANPYFTDKHYGAGYKRAFNEITDPNGLVADILDDGRWPVVYIPPKTLKSRGRDPIIDWAQTEENQVCLSSVSKMTWGAETKYRLPKFKSHTREHFFLAKEGTVLRDKNALAIDGVPPYAEAWLSRRNGP